LWRGRLFGQFARHQPGEFKFLFRILRILDRFVFGLSRYRHQRHGCDLDDDRTR
jgi:hypothetical protein